MGKNKALRESACAGVANEPRRGDWSDHELSTCAIKKKINPTRVPIEEQESIRWLDKLKTSNEAVGATATRCTYR